MPPWMPQGHHRVDGQHRAGAKRGLERHLWIENAEEKEEKRKFWPWLGEEKKERTRKPVCLPPDFFPLFFLLLLHLLSHSLLCAGSLIASPVLLRISLRENPLLFVPP